MYFHHFCESHFTVHISPFLLMLNCALLGKWLWGYGIEIKPWWRVVVEYKFDSLWGEWCSLKPVGAFGVGL